MAAPLTLDEDMMLALLGLPEGEWWNIASPPGTEEGRRLWRAGIRKSPEDMHDYGNGGVSVELVSGYFEPAHATTTISLLNMCIDTNPLVSSGAENAAGGSAPSPPRLRPRLFLGHLLHFLGPSLPWPALRQALGQRMAHPDMWVQVIHSTHFRSLIPTGPPVVYDVYGPGED